MSEKYGEIVHNDEILEEAIEYVFAGSKGNQYKYPEGWDKNMKRSVRKTAGRVMMRGVEVMYKKKNSNEVRIIRSREEQMRIMEMCHSDSTCCMYIYSYCEYSLIRPNWFRQNVTMDILYVVLFLCMHNMYIKFVMYAFASWFVLLLPIF